MPFDPYSIEPACVEAPLRARVGRIRALGDFDQRSSAFSGGSRSPVLAVGLGSSPGEGGSGPGEWKRSKRRANSARITEVTVPRFDP